MIVNKDLTMHSLVMRKPEDEKGCGEIEGGFG
jgi:hypothetical protein